MKAEQQPPSRGERWLDMIGYGHMSKQPTKFFDENDQPILCGNFDTLCEEHASTLMNAIEMTDPMDPQRSADIALARKIFEHYYVNPET